MEANLESWLVGKKCGGRGSKEPTLGFGGGRAISFSLLLQKRGTQRENSVYKCLSLICFGG